MKSSICNCCEPPAQGTPVKINNRPGLSALVYRVGKFSDFRQAMFNGISRAPELRRLSTRRSDDYAITLLELWAAIADILTFYQERIANEAFLRTASLRDSVLRHARMLGYELSPGSAATAYLSFTAEEGKQVDIPVGLRVQSVPGQDESPQKFETLEAITAYAWLNRTAIFPAPVSVNPLAEECAFLTPGKDGLAIAETLAEGDSLLLFNADGGQPVEAFTVRDIEIEQEHMRLRWTRPLQGAGWDIDTQVFKWGRSLRLFGYNATTPYPKASTVDGIVQQWTLRDIEPGIPGMPDDDKFGVAGGSMLHLDTRYENIQVGAKLLLVEADGQQKLLTVTEVDQEDRKLGLITDTVTRVKVSPDFDPINDRRKVLVYELTGPVISFWGYTYPDIITEKALYIPGAQIDADTIEIGRSIEDNEYLSGDTVKLTQIESGRKVLLVKKEPISAVITDAEIVSIAQQDYLKLNVRSDEDLALERKSAVLKGNIALASHGEKVLDEVLGDGDPTVSFQKFSLRKSPVTYIPSAGEGGVENSLQLFVNGALWKEVKSLYGKGSNDTVYTARINNEGEMSVCFGDGVTGARTPAGRSNVTAGYRQGIGLDGRVGAGTLTTLLDRPKGLKSSTNPAGADGGADPEILDDARENAPNTVRTFDRAVSLRDFEDLVRERDEVAKAQATWVWNGDTRAAHLTIAGQEGGIFSPSSLTRIHASLSAQRDPNRILLLDNYKKVPIVMTATLKVADNYVASVVAEAARSTLLYALSFAILEFAQPINLSDVYSILQEVTGVIYVDIDSLMFKKQIGVSVSQFQAFLDRRGIERLEDGTPKAVQGHLKVFPARPNPQSNPLVLPAEQAWIESPTQDVVILTSGGLPD